MWSCRLSDAQRDAVRALIGAQGEVGPSLTGAMEALDLARWDDLPEARLDWERVTELAATQEISEADVVWDLAGASPAPQRKPSKKTGKRAASSQKRPPARRRSA